MAPRQGSAGVLLPMFVGKVYSCVTPSAACLAFHVTFRSVCLLPYPIAAKLNGTLPSTLCWKSEQFHFVALLIFLLLPELRQFSRAFLHIAVRSKQIRQNGCPHDSHHRLSRGPTHPLRRDSWHLRRPPQATSLRLRPNHHQLQHLHGRLWHGSRARQRRPRLHHPHPRAHPHGHRCHRRPAPPSGRNSLGRRPEGRQVL